MMTFRDQTWCIQPCANSACFRCITPEVREAARKWWGGDGAPFSLADMKCPEFQERKD